MVGTGSRLIETNGELDHVHRGGKRYKRPSGSVRPVVDADNRILETNGKYDHVNC